MSARILALTVAAAFTAAPASLATISTYSFTSTLLSGYPPTPVDGVTRSSGDTVTINIAIDQSLTYVGAPDSIVTTPLSIANGLSIDLGLGEVFTASNYAVEYYNSGSSRLTRDYSIRSIGTILHNGVPLAAGAGLIQITFFSPYFTPPAPIAPGLDIPRVPPALGLSEGFLREDNAPYGLMRWGIMDPVPTPGAATLALMAGILTARRRR